MDSVSVKMSWIEEMKGVAIGGFIEISEDLAIITVLSGLSRENHAILYPQ